jgi:hypothetical protein
MIADIDVNSDDGSKIGGDMCISGNSDCENEQMSH